MIGGGRQSGSLCVLVERKQLKKGNEMSIRHCFLSRSSAASSLSLSLSREQSKSERENGEGGGDVAAVEC